ncbi:MAG TPA: alpha/beta fold hydrolase [Rudaea sp.]
MLATRVSTHNTGVVPRFEPAQCPQLPPQLSKARCGYLVVPEDRSHPLERTIRNFVAVIPAKSADKASDPIVYLGTGPGGIASHEAASLVDAGINESRDLIVMNQRGQYLSEPALTCESIDAFTRELVGLRFYSAATKRAHLAATAECHRDLLAKTSNLGAYNSSESAADFADLRSALGIAEWNVLGVSYGTDLSQAYVRDHPDGVRSIVLDSVVPVSTILPDYWGSTRAGFDNLFAACAADPGCNAAWPHLEPIFTKLVNRLEADPRITTVHDSATGEDVKVVLDGGALVDWLRDQSRANNPGLATAPDLIHKLARGRPEALQAIAAYRVGLAPPPVAVAPAASYGLGYGVVCREQYPFPRRELREAGKQAFPFYPTSITEQAVSTWAYNNDDCRQIWRVPAAADAHRPLTTNLPVLLVSGSFDAVTDLDFAKKVAATLSRGTIISIPGIGHFVIANSQCAQTVVRSFFDNPGAADTGCVGSLKPPPFVPSSSAEETGGETVPIID